MVRSYSLSPEILTNRVVKAFWSKVCKNRFGCWEWQGCKLPSGYAQLTLPGMVRRRVLVHRLSYVLHYGEITERGLLVCHRCDNPSCVRPDHLFLGSPKENTQDAYAKGRLRFLQGEKQNNAKLTDEEVQELRRRYKPYHPTRGAKALAKEFGITPNHVVTIVRNRAWKHLLKEEN